MQGRYLQGISANGLKIIAMIAMAIDHMGLILFENNEIMRIIGRLAFPIYAFFIAEGCRYTKDKSKYFLRVLLIGLVCQVVAWIYQKNAPLNILLTFSVSIALTYLLNEAKKSARCKFYFAAAVIVFYIVSEFLLSININFDYGFWGAMLPVIISFSDKKEERLILALFGLCIVSLSIKGIQWYSLISMCLLMMYNGQKGVLNIKFLFYAFYPAHLLIIYLIGVFV